MIWFSSWMSPGALVHLTDTSGSDLLTFSPSKSYESVVFCSPDLSAGTSCSLYTGGSSTGAETDGVYSGGTYSGGTLRSSFTLSSGVTHVNVN